jgi:hypothetical protein
LGLGLVRHDQLRDGRWWVTFQNDVVELTRASEDFMQFGVTKCAGEELRMRAEAKASQVKSHDAIT